ncbi:MAG TPA: aspartate-alanine antiporter [Candidatus Angelobacter sp.]|nr:aspartate-alanine antiporter [Candidatus Angelobacter sp.]
MGIGNGWLHTIFKHSPETALFLSLALGYALGKIHFGRFQLGGVAGSLLAAIVVSQAGVKLDDSLKNIMFALFIYTVGYQSGPQFFSSLNRTAVREVVMSVFVAVVALLTIVVGAKLFHIDKGLAAGIAGGSLNASAMIGTAGEALGKLGLSQEQADSLQANVAIAFGVTYLIGVLAAIFLCVETVPRFMGSDLRTDAKSAEKTLLGTSTDLAKGQSLAETPFVCRTYRIRQGAGKSIQQIEKSMGDALTIERLQRNGRILADKPDLMLEAGDVIVVAGRRNAVVEIAPKLGDEIIDSLGNSLVMQTRMVVFTRKDMNHARIADLRTYVDRSTSHGVYIQSITRMESEVPVLPETEIVHGDVITFYGTAADTKRAAEAAGYELPLNDKTDFIYLGIGMVVGLLFGLITVRVHGIALSMGSGGGALLAGLIFGWLRAKRPIVGSMPSAAAQFLRDFGLAVFVAVLGLNTGLTAMRTLRSHGIAILGLGVMMSVLPTLLAMFFGRYVLKYKNSALLAGALAGSRCSTPAFESLLEKAESSVPTVPFAITYALSNVLLTLLGPVIVGLT